MVDRIPAADIDVAIGHAAVVPGPGVGLQCRRKPNPLRERDRTQVVLGGLVSV